MEEYIEQTASCIYSGKKRMGNMLFGIFAVLFLLLTAVCAAASVSTNQQGALKLNWLSAVGAVICLLAAWLFWRKKDSFCIEYDYSFYGGEISVSAVYNSKRRKNMLNLPLSAVHMCGSTESAAFRKLSVNNNITKHEWYANEDHPLYFFLYEKDGKQCAALLELNDRMAKAISHSKQLTVGSWHDKEGN